MVISLGGIGEYSRLVYVITVNENDDEYKIVMIYSYMSELVN
jgi:hypothetical protein